MAQILFIDDDTSILTLYSAKCQELLSTTDAIITASNGHEALKIFENKPIDVVITDLVMPGLGGVELIALIRKVNSNIPIIAISGYPNIINAAKKAGASNILLKPFTPDELVEAIKVAIKLIPDAK